MYELYNTSDIFYNLTINLTILEYLELHWGPQRSPLHVAILLTIVNLLIFVSGLLGNAAVCIVIIKHSNMHTATNYYLFNLAISDLILLIFGVPNDVAIYWQAYPWRLGEAFCKFRALLSEMASYVSVLTIVAFSTERYLSICYPLYLYTMSGLQRAIRIITCLWFISFLSALPFSIYTKVNYKDYPPGSGHFLKESAFCGMLGQPEYFPLAELSFFIFFVIPMIIIAFQYIMMGLKISNRSLQFGQNNRMSINKDGRKHYSHKGIIRMLAAVVIGFFICWAPFHAQRLIYIYGRSSQYYEILNEWMFYITGILYYFSSTLNPILYNVMSNRYRTAFKEILCGIKTRKDPFIQNSTVRETKVLSRSNSDKTDKYNNAIGEEETLVLLSNNSNIIRNNQVRNSKLYYQINNFDDQRKSKETCI